MSILYGVNYTKYNNGSKESDIGARGAVSGPLSYIRDTYEAAATTAEDTVAVGHKLNAGDRIIAFILSTDNLGGSSVISIGDSDTEGRYAVDIDTNAAVVSGNTAMLVAGCDYVIGTADGDDVILLTLGNDAATGTIKITILYSRV